jgi:hypothetical protein
LKWGFDVKSRHSQSTQLSKGIVMNKRAQVSTKLVERPALWLKRREILGLAISTGVLAACGGNNNNTPAPAPAPLGKDINTATKTSVDRFSASAGHLFVRTATNGLPAANAPINFDVAPFITMGLDRTGAVARYYNLDVQPTVPDDIYVFFKSGAAAPIAGQNNVIPTIPGDTGYNDFWIVNKVTVPDNYVPNSITSEAEVLASKYPITKTTMVVNCPVVPFGSSAARSKTAGVANALTLGWYKGQAVAYFQFDEAALTATATGMVPVDDIYVMFNTDPSAADPTSGPPSGFKTETGTMQTHNVLASLPGDADYTPLWAVSFLSNTHFAAVKDLTTAVAASPMSAGATVNCPIVK